MNQQQRTNIPSPPPDYATHDDARVWDFAEWDEIGREMKLGARMWRLIFGCLGVVIVLALVALLSGCAPYPGYGTYGGTYNGGARTGGRILNAPERVAAMVKRMGGVGVPLGVIQNDVASMLDGRLCDESITDDQQRQLHGAILELKKQGVSLQTIQYTLTDLAHRRPYSPEAAGPAGQRAYVNPHELPGVDGDPAGARGDSDPGFNGANWRGPIRAAVKRRTRRGMSLETITREVDDLRRQESRRHGYSGPEVGFVPSGLAGRGRQAVWKEMHKLQARGIPLMAVAAELVDIDREGRPQPTGRWQSNVIQKAGETPQNATVKGLIMESMSNGILFETIEQEVALMRGLAGPDIPHTWTPDIALENGPLKLDFYTKIAKLQDNGTTLAEMAAVVADAGIDMGCGRGYWVYLVTRGLN